MCPLTCPLCNLPFKEHDHRRIQTMNATYHLTCLFTLIIDLIHIIRQQLTIPRPTTIQPNPEDLPDDLITKL